MLLSASCVALMLLSPTAAATPTDDRPASTEVSFTGADGVRLYGTVLSPTAVGGDRPALVMVPGAGPGGRSELRAAAESYARHGIVALIYDKRTTGYSTLHRDYSLLADDALAALRLLRDRPGVDRAGTGMWGLSEGAWAVSLAANRSADVSFVITAGAVGMEPARQQAWAYGEYLAHAGVSGSLPHTMQGSFTRQLVGAGLFPEADYDPVPTWQHVRQPVLAEWGTLDREAAPQESSRIIARALYRGGNRHYTIRFVPDVRHNLNATRDHGFDRISRLPSDYADFETAWIERLSRGLPPRSIDPAPHQQRQTRALPSPVWYDAGQVQLAALCVLAIGFVGYPLCALVRRVGKGRGRVPSLRAARWLSGTGLAVIVGMPIYLLFLALTAAGVTGPVLLGRTLPWLALQLLAVAVVGATVWTGVSWWHGRGRAGRAESVRLGLQPPTVYHRARTGSDEP
ncbi:alpha/beta hydrolase family protein [Streptomyces atratus]|uniref:alpha/beta hydrolase family protein n=1 Tax=Streptomyces atratus TaxID=1893 RepID=UPI0011611908|nr:alpha/beta hydrolase [Streptomyces atratus]